MTEQKRITIFVPDDWSDDDLKEFARDLRRWLESNTKYAVLLNPEGHELLTDPAPNRPRLTLLREEEAPE